MLRSIEELEGYVLEATDGRIGRCSDFLLEAPPWVVRYMVADTGRWLPGRKVLISPISLGEPDWASHTLSVLLSKQEVEDAPPLDRDAPVSRSHESALLEHHGYGTYWGGAGLWGLTAVPSQLRAPQGLGSTAEPPDQRAEGPPLRSASELMGYDVRATDGSLGRVKDFIVDDETWALRYVVVDTRKWLPGRQVLVAPDWLRSVNWAEEAVEVDLTREQVRNSPPFDPAAPVNRGDEQRLYDFYGRPVYWE